jgi:pimeloyl-ACP methyl ester carboxylesterase
MMRETRKCERYLLRQLSEQRIETDVADFAPEAPPLLVRKPLPYADRWWRSDDGLQLYARDYPAVAGRVRLPVICLHGMRRNSADFETVAPYIAASERRVIAPDLRGRGLSENDPDAGNYHLWTYARDVAQMCDAFGIGQAVFIGSSMGGLVAMVLATLRPHLVRAAVLNDVGPKLTKKGLARIAARAEAELAPHEDWASVASVLAEQSSEDYPNYAASDWLNMAQRLYRKGRDGKLHAAYDPRLTAACRHLTLDLASYDLEPCYASLAHQRPVLLLHGAQSDLIGEKEIRAMKRASRAGGGEFTRVDVSHVGHAPDLSEAQARLAIQDFLDALP